MPGRRVCVCVAFSVGFQSVRSCDFSLVCVFECLLRRQQKIKVRKADFQAGRKDSCPGDESDGTDVKNVLKHVRAEQLLAGWLGGWQQSHLHL